jgi:hypothetical protein
VALEHRVKKLETDAGIGKGQVYFLFEETRAQYEKRTGTVIPPGATVFEMLTERDVNL